MHRQFQVAAALLLAACRAGAVDPNLDVPQTLTTVWVQLQFIDVGDINAVEQSFYADFYATLFWVDNRIEANATFDPTVNFTPDVEFTNRLQKEALNQQWTYQQGWYGVPQRLIPAELENDTVWSAYSRISATFVTTLDMHDFPMDIHNLSVRMESSLLDNTQFLLTALPGTTEFAVPEEMQVVGWNVMSNGAASLNNYYPSFDQTYSQLKAYVKVARQSAYYVDRLVANVVLLVFMAFLASSLKPNLPDRTIAVITVFLAVVSWMFIIIEDSPRVGYLTRLDIFMNLSFAIVFAMAAGHAINHVITSMQETREKRAKRDSMVQLHAAISKLAHNSAAVATRASHGRSATGAFNDDVNYDATSRSAVTDAGGAVGVMASVRRIISSTIVSARGSGSSARGSGGGGRGGDKKSDGAVVAAGMGQGVDLSASSGPSAASLRYRGGAAGAATETATSDAVIVPMGGGAGASDGSESSIGMPVRVGGPQQPPLHGNTTTSQTDGRAVGKLWAIAEAAGGSVASPVAGSSAALSPSGADHNPSLPGSVQASPTGPNGHGKRLSTTLASGGVSSASSAPLSDGAALISTARDGEAVLLASDDPAGRNGSFSPSGGPVGAKLSLATLALPGIGRPGRIAPEPGAQHGGAGGGAAGAYAAAMTSDAEEALAYGTTSEAVLQGGRWPAPGDDGATSPSYNKAQSGHGAASGCCAPCAGCLPCRLCRLVGRTWGRASLERKIDICITVMCAVVYLIGTAIILTVPPKTEGTDL